mmetsp:Transcript_113021/g.324812  ORF Transcript_113021/g.324812 Transcript_113021/m.324812 type:complete len:483 (-) Transcript_113021:690-2138(-)
MISSNNVLMFASTGCTKISRFTWLLRRALKFTSCSTSRPKYESHMAYTVQRKSPERGTMNLILVCSLRPVPWTFCAAWKRRALASYSSTHHSSNFGVGKSGAWTGPTASPSSKLVLVRLTVSVARSPFAMSASSSTSTLASNSITGACRQNASMSNRCSGLRPRRSTNAFMPPFSPRTTSRRVGNGGDLPLAGGSAKTWGNCSKGSASKSKACTMARWNWMRPRTVSRVPQRSPLPRAAIVTMARMMSGEADNICDSSVWMTPSMCRWRRHMWDQSIAVPRRMGVSLKGQGAIGSTDHSSEAGMSLKSVCPGPVTLPSFGNTSTRHIVSDSCFRMMTLRPFSSARSPAAFRTKTHSPGAKGVGLWAPMALTMRPMSPPPWAPASKPKRRHSLEAAYRPGPSSARNSLVMTALYMRSVSSDTPWAYIFVPLRQHKTTVSGAPIMTEKKEHKNISLLCRVLTMSGCKAMPTFICDGPSGLPYFS